MTSTLVRLLPLFILLDASACATAKVARTPVDESGIPGVEYRLVTILPGDSSDRLTLRVYLKNNTGGLLSVTSGACALNLELFRDSSNRARPIWNSGRHTEPGNPPGTGRVCLSYAAMMTASAGATFSSGEFSYTIRVNDLLADSLPDGRYFFDAIVDANNRARLHGGAIELKRLPAEYWDAHTHLSMYGSTALDSLAAYHVTGVRDLGANKLDEILQWRDEIAAHKRKGPRIYTAGVILDGPKEDSSARWIVRTEREGIHAVDSLAKRGVDFIKTHNGLSPPVYFAILRAARSHHLKVASHLPRGIPAWVAADSGASSIEHAAESMMASPIYAGYAKTFDEAAAWWNSPAGDSAIARLKRSGVYFTPTLGFYAANVNLPADSGARAQRRAALPALAELTRKMYLAGIPIMAGSDIATVRPDYRPGQSLIEEIGWLRRAGLSDADISRAASDNVKQWLRKQ